MQVHTSTRVRSEHGLQSLHHGMRSRCGQRPRPELLRVPIEHDEVDHLHEVGRVLVGRVFEDTVMCQDCTCAPAEHGADGADLNNGSIQRPCMFTRRGRAAEGYTTKSAKRNYLLTSLRSECTLHAGARMHADTFHAVIDSA